MKRHPVTQRSTRAQTRTRRARVVLALTLAVLTISSAARAANEPLFESSFPSPGASARSQDADVIFAIYDRPLSEAHSTFRLRDAANNLVPGTTYLSDPQGNIGGDRRINFRPDAPLIEAASSYSVRIKARARVTLGETITEYDFTIDDTPPLAPIVTSPSDGDIITDQPVVVTGTGEPGATILVIEATVLIAQDRVASTGVFDVLLPYPDEDGVSHTFEVFQRDPAGNTGPGTGPITIWHDSVVRAPVISAPRQGAFLNTSTVQVKGTAKAGTTIRIREGGPVIGTTTTNVNEDWQVSIVFADGVHSITAESFDGVMTDGPSPARTFTVDTIAPAAPVITTPSAGTSVSSSDVTIAGTAEADAQVEIRHQGIVRATVPVDGAGAWSVTLPFVEGPHTVEARAIDLAGNIGATASRSFTVDTVAPAAPLITAPTEGAFLNSNNVVIAGDAEANADVEIFVGTVSQGITTANGMGAWSINLPFADGAHSVVAVAIDAAGNRSPDSEARGFTVDTVAPAAPVITEPAQNEVVTSTAVTVTGTGEPAATLEVWEGLILLGTTDVDSEGNWEIDLIFGNGAHQIRARAIDLASNVGPFSAVRDFTVNEVLDVTPPLAPVLIDPAQNSMQPGFVVFRGSAEPGSTVTIYEGASVVATGAAPSGSFEFGAPMGPGLHQVFATATDAADNESASTALRQFTVDNARPTVSIDASDGTVFLLQQPFISGDATDNTGVAFVELEYHDLTGLLVQTRTATCSGCPGSPVSWQDAPSLAPGSYRVDAYAVDLVGNRSLPASIRFYVV